MSIEIATGAQKRHPDGLSLLCVCFFDPTGIATVRESIAAWQKQSRHRIEVLNLWPGGSSNLAIPASMEINVYDAIYIHPTVSYSPANLWSLDSRIPSPFEQYRGLKLIAKQDEHYRSAEIAAFIGAKAFDVVLTCLPPSEWRKVYPAEIVGDCVFLQTLTGYVSPTQQGLVVKPMSDRKIDVAYRGSFQPLSFGRLGREKWEIGERFIAEAARYNLRTDISSEWAQRITGQAWYEFLSDARAVLGVESGSNVFDFDGSLEHAARDFELANKDRLTRSELYHAIEETLLSTFEGNVDYAQVSPRHFEAAAAGAVQILYEGRYSNILTPWRHYLPLRRDFANLPDIVAFIHDDARMDEMAATARAELIDAPTWTYNTFVKNLDIFISDRLASKTGVAEIRTRSQATSEAHVAVLVAHEPSLDPRIDWLCDSLAEHFNVLDIGALPPGAPGPLPTCEALGSRRTRVRIERTHFDKVGLAPFSLSDPRQEHSARAWALLMAVFNTDDAAVINEFGFYAEDVLPRVRNFASYIVDTTFALTEAARRTGGADMFVAADMETLIAGAILATEFSAPLVYDAHEYWPYSYTEFSAAETHFWSCVEALALKATAMRMTVSPPLAHMMSSDYGVPFESVPNAARFAEGIGLRPPAGGDITDFLVQGNFANSRGYEELIDAWPHTPERARLLLRGPDNAFKSSMIERARATGLLDTRILFPEPVSASELIKAASSASVGIIPYKPINAGYRCCCPNKLSQYMAAGLPILANQTDFVGPFVRDNNIGITCDFNDTASLLTAIRKLTDDKHAYSNWAETAFRAFQTKLNWESVSEEALTKARRMLHGKRSERSFDLSWVGAPGVMDKDTREPLIEWTPQQETARQLRGPAIVVLPTPQKPSLIDAVRSLTPLRRIWKALPKGFREAVVKHLIAR